MYVQHLLHYVSQYVCERYYLECMGQVITTPINLGSTLELDDGRAYVGITAATGNEYWYMLFVIHTYIHTYIQIHLFTYNYIV